MVKLVGTGGNQVPTNNMLGNMAFQNKEGVSADLLSLAAGTASAPSLIPSGDTNTGMWFPAADTVAISTNGGERLRVDNSGYVGIGTASPLTFLHVRGGAGGINSILDSNSSSDTRIEFRNNATRAGYVYWDASEVRYFVDTSRFATFYTNASERMRIDSAGNVGIGQTSITAVFGRTVSATGSNGATMRLAGATVTGYMYSSDGLGLFGVTSETNHPLTLGTNSTERMRITNTGNVGIGTTTPSTKLDVVGGANVSTELDYNYTAASLPSAAPALDLNFAMSEGVDQRITFTRATTATFVGSNGLIQTAAANVPRIEYDPVTLECRGLLIEEQRANALTYSSDFTQWTANGATVNSNTVIAPDGTQTADELVRVATTDDSRYLSASFTGDGTKPISFYVKYNTSPSFAVVLFDLVASAVKLNIAFTFTAGVPSASTVTTGTVEGIQNVGDGWYRVKVVSASVTAANSHRVYLYPADAGSSNAQKTTFWGAQAEVQTSTFSTSLIPTIGATATRNADVASVSTQAFPYNSTEGTLVVATQFAGVSTTFYSYYAGLTSGVGVNNFAGITTDSGTLSARVRSNSSDSLNVNFSSAAVGVVKKVGIALKANDFAAVLNGGAAQISTTGAMPVGVTTLNMNYFNSGSQWVRQITYFPRRLTNAQLQALTT